MHIHDAVNEINHLPLFTGDIDLYQKLEIAEKYNCWRVLETKTIDDLEKSVIA
jgi:hypothetical protein